MEVKALLAILAVIAAVTIELTVGWSSTRRRGSLALRHVQAIRPAETVLLIGVSAGMSFVIVFMLGPALGEMLRFAAG